MIGMPPTIGFIIRSASSRGSSLVISQVATSASNFALFVVGAAVLSPTSFGELALTYTPFALTVGIVRSVLGEQLLVEGWPDQGKAGVVALILCLPGSSVLVGIVAISSAAPYFAAALPVAVLQDLCRYHSLAAGRERRVAIADVSWFGVQAAGYAAAASTGQLSPQVLAGLYGAGALAGLAVLSLSATAVLRSTPAFVPSDLKRLRAGLFVDFAASRGIGELLIPLSGVFISPPFAGALRMGQQLVGPVNIFQTVLRLDATISARSLVVPSLLIDRFRTRSQAIVLCLGGLLIPVVFYFDALFGSVAQVLGLIIPFLFLEKFIEAYSAQYVLALRLNNRTAEIGSSRIVAGSLALVVTGLASFIFGAIGFCVGVVVSALITTQLWRLAARRPSTASLLRREWHVTLVERSTTSSTDRGPWSVFLRRLSSALLATYDTAQVNGAGNLSQYEWKQGDLDANRLVILFFEPATFGNSELVFGSTAVGRVRSTAPRSSRFVRPDADGLRASALSLVREVAKVRRTHVVIVAPPFRHLSFGKVRNAAKDYRRLARNVALDTGSSLLDAALVVRGPEHVEDKMRLTPIGQQCLAESLAGHVRRFRE